jgi:predicted adenylyl cyclase CyaB
MAHLNVEIKARCINHDAIRRYLKSHNADRKGIEHQIDTYFNVPNGRLKLRESKVKNFLIQYERDNQEGPKQSKITLYKSEPGSSLKEALRNALGILAIVDKQREIYCLDNVKFHIDTVKNLGSFMEIEAIDIDGTLNKGKLHQQCENYLKELGIKASDLLSHSYSDMILAQA